MRASKMLLWILFAYCVVTIFEFGLPAIIMTGVAFFTAINYTLVRNSHIEIFNDTHGKSFQEELATIQEDKKQQKNQE